VLGAFALSLTRLGRRVTQQLVLPGRQRPGNLLSSLFLLFTGLAEQTIVFRRAVIRIPWAFALKLPARDRLDAVWAFSKKWLRLGLVAAAWILFSFEASGQVESSADALAASTATTVARPVSEVVIMDDAVPAGRVFLSDEYSFPRIQHQGISIRRWLLLRTLRI